MEQYDNIIRIFACISLLIGAVECFAGFKILKTMMVIWAFFIGSMLGVVIGVATESIVLGFISILVFGTILAALTFRFHMAGVFILSSFLAAIALYIIFENIIISLIAAVIAGALSVYFLKPAIIITTAVTGAGIIVSSAYLMMGLGINGSPVITVLLWVPIALVGIAVQFITTQKIKYRKISTGSSESTRTVSERKYPGMQKRYRNFCIVCGCEMADSPDICPRCGYNYEEVGAEKE